jgi:hypothetical protein
MTPTRTLLKHIGPLAGLLTKAVAVVGLAALAAVSAALPATAPAAAQPTPALAPLSDVLPVSDSGDFGPEVVKTVNVRCPEGRVPISGGANVGGAVDARITRLVPVRVGVGGRIEATAIKEQGDNRSWRLSVQAYCILPPDGLEYVSVYAPSFDSAQTHRAVASCPDGKKLIGFGGTLYLPDRLEVLLTGMYPNSSLTSVIVEGIEDEDGYNGSWTVRATAVCISSAYDPLWVDERSPSLPAERMEIWAVCPSSTLPYAAGVYIRGFRNEVNLALIHRSSSLRDGGAEGREDRSGISGNWGITGYAICAGPS